MKISITLPTLFPDLAQIAIKKLRYCTIDFDYEIVVVSPVEISGPNILWIEEESPRGSCVAQQRAFENATGDFVLALSDDYLVEPFWADFIVPFLIEGEKRHKSGPFITGMTPHGLGTVFGIYYPYFPFARRQTIEKLGGWYRSDLYRAHFGDPDLGLRVWSAGGRCELCKPAKLQVLSSRRQHSEAPTKSMTVAQDASNFISQWGDKYGRGFNLSKVRNWNIDIYFEAMRWLPTEYKNMIIENNTFYVNEPAVSGHLEKAMIGRQGSDFSDRYFSMFE